MLLFPLRKPIGYDVVKPFDEFDSIPRSGSPTMSNFIELLVWTPQAHYGLELSDVQPPFRQVEEIVFPSTSPDAADSSENLSIVCDAGEDGVARSSPGPATIGRTVSRLRLHRRWIVDVGGVAAVTDRDIVRYVCSRIFEGARFRGQLGWFRFEDFGSGNDDVAVCMRVVRPVRTWIKPVR